VNYYLAVHQIAALISIYPHFFLRPQKETLAKKKGTRKYAAHTGPGARPHFRESNAHPTLESRAML
jgi:hypothetical protein